MTHSTNGFAPMKINRVKIVFRLITMKTFLLHVHSNIFFLFFVSLSAVPSINKKKPHDEFMCHMQKLSKIQINEN